MSCRAGKKPNEGSGWWGVVGGMGRWGSQVVPNSSWGVAVMGLSTPGGEGRRGEGMASSGDSFGRAQEGISSAA